MTAKRLREQVDLYFDSISREVPATEKVPTGNYDEMGHMILENKPILNRLGEEIMITEYVIPPTVGGLCDFLGIHRSTWADWCNEEAYPEFSDTTTCARGRLRAWREEQLLTRKDVRGLIFDLQNNYGYTEKKQVELGEKATRAVTSTVMTMEERQQLLQQIAKEFQDGGGGDGPESTEE